VRFSSSNSSFFTYVAIPLKAIADFAGKPISIPAEADQ
jgi:hypothetical protein